MGLQGTLDTFTVAEILGLVEHARQTGALEVKGPQGTGTLFASAGRLCAGEAADYSGPVETREELEIRLVDVCFHLFRLEAGGFEFIPGREPSWPAERAVEMTPIVEQAEQLVREWPLVETVVPSLDVAPQLADELTDDELTLSRAGFKVLAAADGQRTVRQIARELHRSAVEVAVIIKELVEQGALHIAGSPRPPRPAPTADTTEASDESEPVPDAAERAGLVLPSSSIHAVREEPGEDGVPREVVTSVPESDEVLDRAAIERERQLLAAKAGLGDPGPVPDPDAFEDEEDDEAVSTRASITTDRGALLRLFSGLRDSS